MKTLADRKILSVMELTTRIKEALEEEFRDIWVRGEISNFKHHSSGHMYFTLKDQRSQIKAACFRNTNRYLKFRPDDGLEVVMRGRVGLYEPRGEYQIIVDFMEPVGFGSLQLAFDQLKEKLRKEGLFDDGLKQPLPMLPRKIGIVTSASGAAIQDMLRVLARRNASLHVLLYPAKVQGTGASGEIAAGVAYFNTRTDIDAIIIGRGGGSIEDLWAFNEEILARAIVQSEIPVISAVGHEVDYTIADFVADVRAATPSSAGEIVSSARDELHTKVNLLHGRIRQSTQLVIERRRSRLEKLSRNRAFEVAPNKIREFHQRFDEIGARSAQAIRRYLLQRRHLETVSSDRLIRTDLRRWVALRREWLLAARKSVSRQAQSTLHDFRGTVRLLAGRMDALSPLAILQRGYSVCRNAEGTILKDVQSVVPWDRVEVQLAKGMMKCQVESIREEPVEPHPRQDEMEMGES